MADILPDSNNLLVPTPMNSLQKSSQTVLTMMRIVFEYASNKSSRMALFLHLDNTGERNEAHVGVLFSFGGKWLEAHELNQSGIKDFTFDVSNERQMQMMGYIGEELANNLVPSFLIEGRKVPNEVWSTYDVATDKHYVTYGFDYGNTVDFEEYFTNFKKELSGESTSSLQFVNRFLNKSWMDTGWEASELW